MSIATLFGYLVGRRDAILRIASTPSALWLGALFVISAAFAREYDAKDLLSEPWYLLVPLVASLATSLILFALVSAVVRWRGDEQSGPWPTYRQFLTLYWMTAPLAWIYALPVERFLSAAGSTQANLTLLAIVSLWRVTLMVRVVMVLFGASFWGALFTVMLFGDSVALVVLYLTPLPVFNVMGGIPLSESESLIQAVAFTVGFFGATTWLVWFFGVLLLCTLKREWQAPQAELATPRRVAPLLWCLAVSAILVWTGILPFTQPAQRLRHEVEHQLTSGQIAEALATMSRHEPSDFPPHWDPPPWLAYPTPRPPLLDVMEVLLRVETAPWVRETFLGKLEKQTGGFRWTPFEWQQKPDKERERLVAIFEQSPDRAALVDKHVESFQMMWSTEEDPTRKERLRALLAEAGHEVQETNSSVNALDY